LQIGQFMANHLRKSVHAEVNHTGLANTSPLEPVDSGKSFPSPHYDN
jgi:hypothetical protein